MSCPQDFDFDGKPRCHITAHPDHPDQPFCCFCNKPIKFVNEGDNAFNSLAGWFFLFLIVAVIVFITLPQSNDKAKKTSFSESLQYARK